MQFKIILKRVIHILMIMVLVSTPYQAYAQSGGGMPLFHQWQHQQSFVSMVDPIVDLKGLSFYPEDPLRLDFYVAKPNQSVADIDPDQAQMLIKYFFTNLTTPDDELWVNLHPDEPERIIPVSLAQTQMGRDMVVQDYLLKQLTASLLHPDGEEGKLFWRDVYTTLFERYGTTEIPQDAFHRVWIVPEQATVYRRDNNIFVVKRHLKVMLERDYVVIVKNDKIHSNGINVSDTSITDQVMRNVILPAIEHEVNHGNHFNNLRQIYDAMILATWYKRYLKGNVLNQVYKDQHYQRGLVFDQRTENAFDIWQRYHDSYEEGLYDMIREEYTSLSETEKMLPRHYFSGGLQRVNDVAVVAKPDDLSVDEKKSLLKPMTKIEAALGSTPQLGDAAMNTGNPEDLDNISFTKGTYEGRNNAVIDILSHPQMKSLLGVDLNTSQVNFYDIGVSSGVATSGLKDRLQQLNNPNLKLIATELPSALAKAYIRSPQLMDPSNKANQIIMKHLNIKMRNVADIRLMVNQHYELSDVYVLTKMEDSNRYFDVHVSVFKGRAYFEQGVVEETYQDIKEIADALDLDISPKALKQMIDGKKNDEIKKKGFSVSIDPIQQRLGEDVDVIATAMPNFKQWHGRNVILLAHVLDHYSQEMGNDYLDNLSKQLNSGDVVVLNIYEDNGENYYFYQKKGDVFYFLGEINRLSNGVFVQSSERISINFNRTAMIAIVEYFVKEKLSENSSSLTEVFYTHFSNVLELNRIISNGLTEFNDNDHVVVKNVLNQVNVFLKQKGFEGLKVVFTETEVAALVEESDIDEEDITIISISDGNKDGSMLSRQQPTYDQKKVRRYYQQILDIDDKIMSEAGEDEIHHYAYEVDSRNRSVKEALKYTGRNSEKHRNQIYLTFDQQENVVGYILYEINLDGNSLDVHYAAIDPEYKGKSIQYYKLLKYVFNYTLEAGIQKFHFPVLEQNSTALDLYRNINRSSLRSFVESVEEKEVPLSDTAAQVVSWRRLIRKSILFTLEKANILLAFMNKKEIKFFPIPKMIELTYTLRQPDQGSDGSMLGKQQAILDQRKVNTPPTKKDLGGIDFNSQQLTLLGEDGLVPANLEWNQTMIDQLHQEIQFYQPILLNVKGVPNPAVLLGFERSI